MLTRLAQEALERVNAFPTSLTERARVAELMRQLRPVKTDKPLIRLGPRGDGGYLVPDDLEGVDACFSAGVDQVSGFEKDCAVRGMQVFMADASVQHPAEPDDAFHFEQRFVGVTTNAKFMTMDSWVERSPYATSSELLLQMDIEGYEYETLLGMSDQLLKRFRVLVVEFHHLNQFWNLHFFNLASRAFEKILQSHDCVHIHPNNVAPPINKQNLVIPPLMEFTFLRRDRILSQSYATQFPHALDVDNTDQRPLVLPPCWHE